MWNILEPPAGKLDMVLPNPQYESATRVTRRIAWCGAARLMRTTAGGPAYMRPGAGEVPSGAQTASSLQDRFGNCASRRAGGFICSRTVIRLPNRIHGLPRNGRNRKVWLLARNKRVRYHQPELGNSLKYHLDDHSGSGFLTAAIAGSGDGEDAVA